MSTKYNKEYENLDIQLQRELELFFNKNVKNLSVDIWWDSNKTGILTKIIQRYRKPAAEKKIGVEIEIQDIPLSDFAYNEYYLQDDANYSSLEQKVEGGGGGGGDDSDSDEELEQDDINRIEVFLTQIEYYHKDKISSAKNVKQWWSACRQDMIEIYEFYQKIYFKNIFLMDGPTSTKKYRYTLQSSKLPFIVIEHLGSGNKSANLHKYIFVGLVSSPVKKILKKLEKIPKITPEDKLLLNDYFKYQDSNGNAIKISKSWGDLNIADKLTFVFDIINSTDNIKTIRNKIFVHCDIIQTGQYLWIEETRKK